MRIDATRGVASLCLMGLALLISPTFLARWIEVGAPQLGLLVTLVHAESFGLMVTGSRALLMGVALWILVRGLGPASRVRSVVVLTLASVTVAVGVASLWVNDVMGAITPDREDAREMAAIEEIILGLGAPLRALETSVENLELPSSDRRGVFDDTVDVLGIRDHAGSASASDLLAVHVDSRIWALETSSRRQQGSDVALWRPYLRTLRYVEHAQFSVVDGDLDESGLRFTSDVRFTGLARLGGSRRWSHVSAVQTLRWRRPAIDSSDWTIQGWEQHSFETRESTKLLFTEGLDRAVDDPALRARVRRSIHEEKVLDAIREPDRPDPHPYFQVPSADRHPAVSVVDIDDDGDDDLYVMARWGKNLLLRNRGDGSFDEAAESFGLDISDHSSSAMFADFDNDGDPDLFLGRTLEPSKYLINEGGIFVDRTEELLQGLPPRLVSSVSAADYDGDGLLDLYIATFAPDVAATDSVAALMRGTLLPSFLSPRHAEAYHARFFGEQMHPILANVGPPNILLKNLGGGRLAPPATEGPEVLYRHTYQASWSDIDNDGDPDLYCANDVAENTMLLNRGDGTFEDVTMQTNTADIGFGMGVSFGDYDADGLQDLYVTNMYSKAGIRITARLGELDPTFADMARGNTLFRNEGGRFRKVSGLEPPKLLVEKAGWGWGGQFVDLNNDGYLDIYTLSGYFTAPEEVALPVDT